MAISRHNRFGLTGGMVSDTGSLILKETDAELLKNVDLSIIGKLKKRKGTKLFGSQLVDNKPVLGMYEFTTSAGTSYQLAVCSDGSYNDIYYNVETTLNGAITTASTSVILTDATNIASSGTIEVEGDLITYTGKTTNTLTGATGITHGHADDVTTRQWKKVVENDTKDKKTRFATLVNYVFRVNGSQAMSSSTDGTTWGTTNCLTTSTTSLIATFVDRVFTAGDATYPDRVYASSIPSVTNELTWDRTTQIIDSIGSNGFYIDINPEDSCYDEQTEILTNKGWKYFKELDKTEEVMTLNQDNRKLEWQKPIEYIEKDYSGEMIHFKSKSNDLLVTPNHQFFIEREKGKINSKKTWTNEFHRADSIPVKSSRIPRTAKWLFGNICENPLGISTKNWVAFLGFWLAEGSVAGSIVGDKQRRKSRVGYRITISSARDLDDIRDMLIKTGLDWKEGKNRDNGCINFYINNKVLHQYLFKLGNSHTKYIPDEIKELPKKYLKILWGWMYLGDGNRSGQPGYTTVSKKLSDDIQEILLKIGLSSRVYKREEKTLLPNGVWFDFVGYHITVVLSKYSYFSWGKNNNYLSSEVYNGKIYCVEVPNHILYVRRNGKPSFCGNSNITALERNGSTLLIGKDRAIYTWNGSATQADELISVGMVSQEVVKTVQNITFFLGRSKKELGIFAYTGGYPKNIGRKVKKWIDNIDQTNLSNYAAGVTNDKYMLYIGDISFTDDEIYGTRTFSDVWLIYSISNDSWVVWTGLPARVFGSYTVSSAEKSFYGDNDGKILEIESGETDDSGDSKIAIEMEFISKEETFHSVALPKRLEQMIVYSTNPQDSNMKYRYNRDEDWINLDSLNDRVTVLDAPQKDNWRRGGETIQFMYTNATENTSDLEGYVLVIEEGSEVRGENK